MKGYDGQQTSISISINCDLLSIDTSAQDDDLDINPLVGWYDMTAAVGVEIDWAGGESAQSFSADVHCWVDVDDDGDLYIEWDDQAEWNIDQDVERIAYHVIAESKGDVGLTYSPMPHFREVLDADYWRAVKDELTRAIEACVKNKWQGRKNASRFNSGRI